MLGGKMMKIKTSTKTILGSLSFSIISLIVPLESLILRNMSDIVMDMMFGLGISLLMLVIFVFPIIRVIVMNESGCTICWLMLKKGYAWDEFKIIQEDYYNYKNDFEGVFFSVKLLEEKKGKDITYQIVNSLDFLGRFYVSFSSKKNIIEREYLVEREEFLAQLEEWGVNVEIGESLLLRRRKIYRQEEWDKQKEYRELEWKKRKGIK